MGEDARHYSMNGEPTQLVDLLTGYTGGLAGEARKQLQGARALGQRHRPG